MYRCGIPRRDGTTRIGVLCEECSRKAVVILIQREQPFFQRKMTGDTDTPCEACLSHGRQLAQGE